MKRYPNPGFLHVTSCGDMPGNPISRDYEPPSLSNDFNIAKVGIRPEKALAKTTRAETHAFVAPNCGGNEDIRLALAQFNCRTR
jgi:hypothetical protein